jgi:predicted lipoprotein with Yx(FWY)xxD motif
MNRLRLAAPLLGLGIILAACGSSGSSPAATSAPTAAPTTAAASEAPGSAAPASAPATGDLTVNLADTSLGSVLVDGSGRTLYIFTADSGGKSVCNGDCAGTWPPLLGDAVPAVGTGLDAAGFATITRDDGSSQVSFHGMPLYYFAADAAAGDTKGQGIGGKWFVIGANGTPIQ